MTTGFDQTTIEGALRRLIGEAPRIVVLHSALYPFRVPEADLKWPLLAALRRLTAEGQSFALPAFTFSFCREGTYHHRDSRSGAGVLADWLLELDGARRSAHPIYSFALLGTRSDEILACPSSTTFGPDSPFGLFERENARLVMLGCPWDACTQFHATEEKAQVPYRDYMTFEGEADFGRGAAPAAARMFVRDLTLSTEPVNDFSAALASLRAEGRIATETLGPATLEAVDCGDFAAQCRALLDADPYAFVAQPGRVAYAVELAERRTTEAPLKLALLGQANLDLLAAALERRVAELIPDRRVELHCPAFGQAARELATDGSLLATFAPDILFFADRLEDLLRVDSLDDAGEDPEPVLDRYLDQIRIAMERFQAQAFVLDFAALQAPTRGVADAEISDGVAALVESARHRLAEGLASLPGAHRLDLAAEARRFSGVPFDPRLWFLGRLPFSKDFNEALAARIAAMTVAATGRGLRLLAVDLDNTLWGGVLGEDGLEGLQLGGDYPGNAHAHLQRTLKHLSERGLALAVLSKNDEAEALAAMAQLPGMVLSETDLAAWRIDWSAKPRNLMAIADEVGLGLESIGFLDDNPAERERMCQTLPAVKVIELPDDPARYAEALLASPYLECLTLTEEDRKRAGRYVAKRQAVQEQQRFERVEDFYAHLSPTLHIAPLGPTNLARAEQLAQKTNQFNTTCRRYSRAALEAAQAEGPGVFVIGLEDRYSERENIGLVVLERDAAAPDHLEIALLLLSCRVLGRGVEDGLIAWLAGFARRRGYRSLSGEILEKPRNAPVRGLYRDQGFTAEPDGRRWTLALSGALPALPRWITLVEADREVEHAA